MKSRYPITFWALVALAALFVLAEVNAVALLWLNPCEGCPYVGYLLLVSGSALMWLALPVGLVGVLLDAIRTRIRLGTWRPPRPSPVLLRPPRPDSTMGGD